MPKLFWLFLLGFLISMAVLIVALSEAGFLNTGLESYFGASNSPKSALSDSKSDFAGSYSVNGDLEFKLTPLNNDSQGEFSLVNNFSHIIGSVDENLRVSWKSNNSLLAKNLVPALSQENFLLELYHPKNSNQVLVRDDLQWLKGNGDDLPISMVNWSNFISQIEAKILNANRIGGATIKNLKAKKYTGDITDPAIAQSLFPWLQVREANLKIEFYIGARDKRLYEIIMSGDFNTQSYKTTIEGKMVFSNFGQSENSKPLESEIIDQDLQTWSEEKGLVKLQ